VRARLPVGSVSGDREVPDAQGAQLPPPQTGGEGYVNEETSVGCQAGTEHRAIPALEEADLAGLGLGRVQVR
jgi:hypothetical protein